MQALSGSGMSCMSDSWIAFQPAIDEPSNMMPSLKVSSSTVVISTVTCCHLPRGSVKRKSAYFTSLSLISFMTSLAVVMERIPFFWWWSQIEGILGSPSSAADLDRVQAGFARSDPDGFFDGGDEDFSITD